MSEKWMEHAKTAALVTLVTISLVLTGFLWFSSPGYQTNPFTKYDLSYIYNGPKYNDRVVYQLASPYQIIVHYNNKISWLLPEGNTYAHLTQLLQNANFDEFTTVTPNPDTWKTLFNQDPGAELVFPRDVSVQYADAFFDDSLLQKYPLNGLDSISRIWFFYNPTTKESFVWFISAQKQQIVQAKVDLGDKHLEDEIARTSMTKSPPLTVVFADGKAPWEQKGKAGNAFSRVFYLPAAPFQMNEWTFKLNQFDIDQMKKWLFKDPSVEPFVTNKNEDLYMNNNEFLTYNKKENFMSYSQTPDDTEPGSSNIYTDLTHINNFVQRHHGWTGNYLLDEVKSNDNNEYTFRLLVKGYPVYWAANAPINPDQIQLQTSPNEVTKYYRTVYFLGSPDRNTVRSLPGKDQLIQSLAAKKISLSSVEQIYPGYQAFGAKDRQAVLKPVWIVITTSGQRIFISSP
jgi:regulatory protein YycH of two-component signal transduction system YycFG